LKAPKTPDGRPKRTRLLHFYTKIVSLRPRPHRNDFCVKMQKSCTFGPTVRRFRCLQTGFSDTRSQGETAPWSIKLLTVQSTRFNNCFLLLDFMFAYNAQAWCACYASSSFFFWWKTSAKYRPWICTTAFLQLDVFLQCVHLYGEIPETTARKSEGKRLFLLVWPGPAFPRWFACPA
jgi:hypothetical protein